MTKRERDGARLLAYGPMRSVRDDAPLQPCGDLLPMRGPSFFFFLLTRLITEIVDLYGLGHGRYPRFKMDTSKHSQERLYPCPAYGKRRPRVFVTLLTARICQISFLLRTGGG